MIVNANQNKINFKALKAETSVMTTACKQYKQHFPKFMEDMKFLGYLNELLSNNGGKGLSIHISSDGDSVIYKTANLTTKNLSDAVIDSCGEEISHTSNLYTRILNLGKIPQ